MGTSKFHITDSLWGEFLSQRANNAEKNPCDDVFMGIQVLIIFDKHDFVFHGEKFQRPVSF